MSTSTDSTMRHGGLGPAQVRCILAGIALVVIAAGSALAQNMSMRKLQVFASDGTVVDWFPIDDRVMGGVSQSRLEPIENGMSFVGTVSVERGGGFASIRSADLRLDLSDCDALVLRIRGDGKRYKLRLKNGDSFDGVVYQSSFDTHRGEWREVELPLNRFAATWRGYAVADAPPLDTSRVTSLGLLISDRQTGPFRLDIESIGCRHD